MCSLLSDEVGKVIIGTLFANGPEILISKLVWLDYISPKVSWDASFEAKTTRPTIVDFKNLSS